MRITVDGKLGKGVTAKDVALYMMSKMTTSGATGYFVEYAGEAVRSLSMEGTSYAVQPQHRNGCARRYGCSGRNDLRVH